MPIYTVDDSGQLFVTPEELDDFDYYRDNVFVRTFEEFMMGGASLYNLRYFFDHSIDNYVGIRTNFGIYEDISYDCYIYLSNVAIAQGATISSAYLSLNISGGANQDINLEISGYDADDTSYPVDAEDFFAKYTIKTSNLVTWNDGVVSWDSFTFYQSPSLINIIQEIVDRPGWVSGNGILLFLHNQHPWQNALKLLQFGHYSIGYGAYASLYINGSQFIAPFDFVGGGTAGTGNMLSLTLI
jgi:hypothetical protein